MLDKKYDPIALEKPIYEKWEATGCFEAKSKEGARPFVIMMPPPNVTGSLHMGHALNYTLQDVLIRYNRMLGRDTLWLPGTDHAGIATQSVVEKQMDAEGLSRHDLGREKFLERVWEWKEESGGTIVEQQKRLGASPDWSRERFTMDEGLNRAVREVFVRLYKEGLIYKDLRLVNWDPKLCTAVSDVEVETVQKNGHFWHIKYPIVGEADKYIVVATTRPETLFGDAAVAVHPEDERYQNLIGKTVKLPLTDKEIPIIADEHSDPEKGTGAVKITPAHDFDDFEVGKRHDLNMLTIMDEKGYLNDQVPTPYQGLERFEARKKAVKELEDEGLMEKIEAKEISVPYGERSGVVLEPRLTDQWFVDAKTLAKPALEAVESGETNFVPDHWKATYYEWMRNIQPWCISRQIWWGHQVPVWYGPDKREFVALTEEDAQAEADAHYGKSVELVRDSDVLDTWFSSALWPFSTLGWPDQTEDLEKYYPGSVLITGFDIIFFWVARMMMMGIHFMGKPPFKTVYINALVRDEKGQKMSKSKGNVIDPNKLMDQYGADALRFCMAALAAPGVDVKFSDSQIEGYRNFCTKLWNAARFSEHNECQLDASFDPYSVKNKINQWIVDRLINRANLVSDHLTNNRFDLAASALYQFAWAEFCDWYIEFSKPLLNDEAYADETRQTTAWVLAQILHLLHPFIPYITEEIWDKMFGQSEMLIGRTWPTYRPTDFADASDEVSWLIKLITGIRGLRAEVNLPAGAKINVGATEASPQTKARLETHAGLLQKLARIEAMDPSADGKDNYTSKSVSLVHEEATYLIPVGDLIDIDSESKRLMKNIAEAEKEITGISKKLGNPQFVDKAPADIIEKNKARLEESIQLKENLEKVLMKLGVTPVKKTPEPRSPQTKIAISKKKYMKQGKEKTSRNPTVKVVSNSEVDKSGTQKVKK